MKLHFGEPQTTVLIVFAALALGLAVLFAFVAFMTRRSTPLEQVQQVGYRLRRGWLVFLVMLLIATVGTSLFFLPYPSGAKPQLAVEVTGGQFFWTITPPEATVGSRMRFDVTSADVNHGFGIYDPDGQLLGSVQAMPGYHNKLDLTLDKPGDYLISCLEFCGAGHHLMSAHFKVVER